MITPESSAIQSFVQLLRHPPKLEISDRVTTRYSDCRSDPIHTTISKTSGYTVKYFVLAGAQFAFHGISRFVPFCHLVPYCDAAHVQTIHPMGERKIGKRVRYTEVNRNIHSRIGVPVGNQSIIEK